ncbi:unnamed protein product [Caenorhabditis auriculariae]|uniref:Uncharacterized protein n=1 Tax=Caenorhabditis auriculariae TaxID=2777116 RepID=A0A8S1GT55_9PELO|nr:unnamed protein product [Caenorhabditis auriculariae]
MDSYYFAITCKLWMVSHFAVIWIVVCCAKKFKNAKEPKSDKKRPKEEGKIETPMAAPRRNRILVIPNTEIKSTSNKRRSPDTPGGRNIEQDDLKRTRDASNKDTQEKKTDVKSEAKKSAKTVVYDPDSFNKLDNTIAEDSHPRNVKYQGNIDAQDQKQAADIVAEINAAAQEKSKSENDKKKSNEKVTINEKKCVLYETNDIETEEYDLNNDSQSRI